MTVTSAPITIGINVAFMLHSFWFPFLNKVRLLIFSVAFFRFYSVVSQNGKVQNSAIDFIFLLLRLFEFFSSFTSTFCPYCSGFFLFSSFFLLFSSFKSTSHFFFFAQSAGAVEYTDGFSAEGYPPTTSVLIMTVNNLMVRFQQCWSFGECGVPLYCHHSQVHSGPEW